MTITVSSTLLLASPTLALTDFCKTPDGAGTEFCENKNNGEDPITGGEGILSKILNIMSVALAVVAVLVIIIAGFNLAFSSGNPEAVARGRNMITYAAIGMGIAITARALVALVLTRIGI